MAQRHLTDNLDIDFGGIKSRSHRLNMMVIKHLCMEFHVQTGQTVLHKHCFLLRHSFVAIDNVGIV